MLGLSARQTGSLKQGAVRDLVDVSPSHSSLLIEIAIDPNSWRFSYLVVGGWLSGSDEASAQSVLSSPKVFEPLMPGP